MTELPEGAIVVTAAGSGIGRATAAALAEAGARTLALIDIDGAGLAAARDLIESGNESGNEYGNVDVTTHLLDCTDRQAVQQTFETIAANQGPIAALVNGVGSSGRERAAYFHELDLDVAEFVIRTSLLSAVYCARQVVPGMRERRAGAIVNIASGVGQRPEPGLVDYGAAKAGVIGLTRGLAAELAPRGVNVNAVSPGPIRTQALSKMPGDVMASIEASIPAGRLGEPGEVAAAIVFLLSARARYIHGQVLGVDGGWFVG